MLFLNKISKLYFKSLILKIFNKLNMSNYQVNYLALFYNQKDISTSVYE